jgi:hypothetical protein
LTGSHLQHKVRVPEVVMVGFFATTFSFANSNSVAHALIKG